MADIARRRMEMTVRHMRESREALRETSIRQRAERAALYEECALAGGHEPWEILPGQEHPNIDGSWSQWCPRCGMHGPNTR